MVAIVSTLPVYAKETKNDVLLSIVSAINDALKGCNSSRKFSDLYYSMCTCAENSGLGTALMIVSTTELDRKARNEFYEAMEKYALFEKLSQLLLEKSKVGLKIIQSAPLSDFVDKVKEDPSEKDELKKITATERTTLERKGVPGWADAQSRKMLVELILKQLQVNDAYIAKFCKKKKIDYNDVAQELNLSLRSHFLIGLMQGIEYARKVDIDNVAIIVNGEKLDIMNMVTAAEDRLNSRRSLGNYLDSIKIDFPKYIEILVGKTVAAPQSSKKEDNSGIFARYLRSILTEV